MAGRRGLYTPALLRDPSPARPLPAKYKSATRSSRARSIQISAESARRPAPRARAGNSCTNITAARRVCRAALCISGRAYYPEVGTLHAARSSIVSVERTSVVRPIIISPSALGRWPEARRLQAGSP